MTKPQEGGQMLNAYGYKLELVSGMYLTHNVHMPKSNILLIWTLKFEWYVNPRRDNKKKCV
jgi:hypothetical protein